MNAGSPSCVGEEAEEQHGVQSELTFLLLLHLEVDGLYAVHNVAVGQQRVGTLKNTNRPDMPPC